MDTMYFSWLESPVDIDASVQLAQFELQDKILYDCSQNYTAGIEGSKTAKKSAFGLKMAAIVSAQHLVPHVMFAVFLYITECLIGFIQISSRTIC